MSSWLSLMFKVIELVGLVLSFAEFCVNLFQFGSGKSRWRVGSKRSVSSPRFGF